jgi:hypothetical protein
MDNITEQDIKEEMRFNKELCAEIKRREAKFKEDMKQFREEQEEKFFNGEFEYQHPKKD